MVDAVSTIIYLKKVEELILTRNFRTSIITEINDTYRTDVFTSQ